MKLVVVADLHIHPFRPCSQDGGRDRLRDGLSVLDQSLQLAEAQAATWLFCGDLKQPRWVWPQEALAGILETFRKYRGVRKVMIPGNHDGDVTALGGSGLTPFSDLALVVEEVRLVDGVLCVPAGHHDRVTASRLGEAEFVCGHAFLAGVALGPEEVRVGGGLDVAAFVGHGAIRAGLFGDIHKGQMLVRDRGSRPRRWRPHRELAAESRTPVTLRVPAPWQGEVMYPGSPYAQNWGEREDGAKGVLAVDLDDGEVILHPLRAPRYREVAWADLGRVEELREQARGWEGDFIRVLVGSWAEQRVGLAAIESVRAASGARWFHAAPISDGSIRHDGVATSAGPHAGLEPEAMLRAYVRARPCEAADEDTALRAGLKLYQEGRADGIR